MIGPEGRARPDVNPTLFAIVSRKPIPLSIALENNDGAQNAIQQREPDQPSAALDVNGLKKPPRSGDGKGKAYIIDRDGTVSEAPETLHAHIQALLDATRPAEPRPYYEETVARAEKARFDLDVAAKVQEIKKARAISKGRPRRRLDRDGNLIPD
jgi:hypothetical protein